MSSLQILTQIFSSPWGFLLAIFFFGLSIFVHELGHYLAARWRGLKIERFSIGFGRKIWGWTDRHGVEWCISVIPLGGYVLLPQLADMKGIEGPSNESRGSLPELGWFDKVTVSAAGAFFNFLFALSLGCVLWAIKMEEPDFADSNVVGAVIETVETSGGETVPSPAVEAGLKPGDRIIEIDGAKVTDFEQIRSQILLGHRVDAENRPAVNLKIERDGTTADLILRPVLVEKSERRLIGIAPASPIFVDSVIEHGPAEKAGVKSGDWIVKADGAPLYTARELFELCESHVDRPLALTIRRDEKLLNLEIVPRLATVTAEGDKRANPGIIFTYPTKWVRPNPLELIGQVFATTWQTIQALVSPHSNVGFDDMSSVVGILYTLKSFAVYDIRYFLYLVLFVNVNLGVINLMPLPILDGGHIVLATIKKAIGRPVPARIVSSLQGFMLILLLSGFIYVTFHDVIRTKDQAKEELEWQQERKTMIKPVFEKEPAEPEASPES